MRFCPVKDRTSRVFMGRKYERFYDHAADALAFSSELADLY